MNELPLSTFKKAIRAVHDAEATLFIREHVREEFNGAVVWDGTVLIFDLVGHPTANRCYAWSVDGRITAVLHEPPIDSPLAAVRAAIVEETR